MECEPLIGWLPLQAPEAEHAVAFAADQVSIELVPLEMELGLALKLTWGACEFTEIVADCVAPPPSPVQLNV